MSKKQEQSTPRRWKGLGRWLGRRTTVEGWSYHSGRTSGRRGARGKHAAVTVRQGNRTYEWRPTKRPPWVVRAENRRRNRAARRSRRVNRR